MINNEASSVIFEFIFFLRSNIFLKLKACGVCDKKILFRSKFKIFLFLTVLIELVVFRTGKAPSNFLRLFKSLFIKEIEKFKVDEIPENFRIAVVLRDFQELSYDEISKILEIPIGTIKSRINRGRIQLSEKMKHFKEQ